MDSAEPGLPERVEAAAPTGSAELRVGVFGVVVVRDHDRAVRAAGEPKGDCGINGGSDTDDVVDLRVPIVAGVRRVDSGGERTRGESARQSKGISDGIRVFGGCDGVFSNHVCIRDERYVGPDVHF